MTRETNFRTRGQAVFLAVIMVLSMVAMSATMIGGVAATHDPGDADVTIGPTGEDNHPRVFQGQTIAFELAANEDHTILDDDGSSVGAFTTDGDGHALIPTGAFASGIHRVEDEGGAEVTSFRIDLQLFSGAFADEAVGIGGESELEITSANRPSAFNVTIGSEDFDQDELLDIFDGSIASGDDDVLIEDVAGGTGVTHVVDAAFAGVSAGEYTFDLDVEDTTASDTASIEVIEVEEFHMELAEAFPSFVIGDNAKIEFDVSGQADGQEVEVVITHFDTGWDTNVSLTLDDDVTDEGSVTLEWNTFSAGYGTPIDSFDADHASVDSADHFVLDGTGFRIPLGDYEVEVLDQVGETVELDTLELVDRSTDSLSTYIAPAAASIESVEDFDEHATERGYVAEGDQVIFVLEVSGIYAYGIDVDDPQEFDAGHGLMFSLDQTDPGPFQTPDSLNETAADSIIVDEDDKKVYLIFDSEDIRDGDRSEWDVSFTVNESNPYIEAAEDTETVETTLSIEDASWTLDEIDPLLQAPEVEFTGSTNLAPGTDTFEIRVRAPGHFQRVAAAEVHDGGWVAVVENLAEEQSGLEVTVTLRVAGSPELSYVTTLADFEPGQPALSLEDVDAPDAVDPGDTATWVATMQNLGDAEGTASVTLLVESATEIIAEETVEVTVAAGDTEDVEFSAVMDVDPGFYGWTISEDFAATSMDGQIEVVDPDPDTPTPTPTPVPPDTPTPTPEPDDQPGFGLIIALMAILGAALLAYRRYQG